MSAVGYATGTRNAFGDALRTLLDGGFIDIYGDTRPTDANTAIGAQTKLAVIPLASPMGAVTSGGVLTFTTTGMTDSAADAGGENATWARFYKSDHTTVVMDCDVTNNAGAGPLKFITDAFIAGQPITITALTWTAPPAA